MVASAAKSAAHHHQVVSSLRFWRCWCALDVSPDWTLIAHRALEHILQTHSRHIRHAKRSLERVYRVRVCVCSSVTLSPTQHRVFPSLSLLAFSRCRLFGKSPARFTKTGTGHSRRTRKRRVKGGSGNVVCVCQLCAAQGKFLLL